MACPDGPAEVGRHNCRKCSAHNGLCSVHGRIPLDLLRKYFRNIIVSAFEDDTATVPGERFRELRRMADEARASMLESDGRTPLDDMPQTEINAAARIAQY